MTSHHFFFILHSNWDVSHTYLFYTLKELHALLQLDMHLFFKLNCNLVLYFLCCHFSFDLHALSFPPLPFTCPFMSNYMRASRGLVQDESSKWGDESHQITFWKLLYWVQHLSCPVFESAYDSKSWRRFNTCLVDFWGWDDSQVWSPAAVLICPAQWTWAIICPPAPHKGDGRAKEDGSIYLEPLDCQ